MLGLFIETLIVSCVLLEASGEYPTICYDVTSHLHPYCTVTKRKLRTVVWHQMEQYIQILNPCNISFLCITFTMETFVLGTGHYKIIITVRGKSSIGKDLAPLKIKSPLHTKKPSRSFLWYFASELPRFLLSCSTRFSCHFRSIRGA